MKTRAPLTVRLIRFLIGLTAIALFAGFFASGYTPPGICGEVLRHNQDFDIDASPLLYSEVEHMTQLEEGVKKLRDAAKKRTSEPNNRDNTLPISN